MPWPTTAWGSAAFHNQSACQAPAAAPYNASMGAWYTSQPLRRTGDTFVVTCKRCTRSVSAGVEAFPRENLVVHCPLCGELRRYRPSEVYLGWLDSRLAEQAASLHNHRDPTRRKPPRRANH